MTLEELEDWEHLSIRIRQEGFHYCFKHYSNFEEIKDEKFHNLRKQYISVSNEIEQYVKDKIEQGNEEIEY